MAATRMVSGAGVTGLVSIAWSSIWFQSLISSAVAIPFAAAPVNSAQAKRRSMHFIVFILQLSRDCRPSPSAKRIWKIRHVRDQRRMLWQHRAPGVTWQDSAGEIQVK